MKLSKSIQDAVVSAVQQAMNRVEEFNQKHATVVEVDYYGVHVTLSSDNNTAVCKVDGKVTFSGNVKYPKAGQTEE